MYLERGVIDVIVAADHVRDVHVEVVHHDAEVVGRHAVGAQQHEVVELLVRKADRPFHQVVPADLALLRRLEADYRRPVAIAETHADRPIVAGLFASSELLLSQLVERILGHVVAIGVARSDELLGDFLVAREALHLEEGPLVPVEAEPLHALEDRVDRLLGRALEVGVLDAQDEFSAVPARIGPAEQRRARAADVQEAGRAGREAGASIHRKAYCSPSSRSTSRKRASMARSLTIASRASTSRSLNSGLSRMTSCASRRASSVRPPA